MEPPKSGARSGVTAMRGMTLVELLVVLGIIAIVAAIILPTIASSRQAAYKVTAIKQLGQLGTAAALYSADFDAFVVPATNYGAGETDPGRMWTTLLYGYAGSDKQPFIAKGSNGQYAASWDLRGWQSFGMNSAAAIDEVNGCTETMDDKTNCQAFTDGLMIDKSLNSSAVALFTTTPAGATEDNYRGYEFNPYNGIERSSDVMESPPLVSDRDLVVELPVLPGDLIKAVYARYGSTGKDEGMAPVLFADNHVKVFSAKTLREGKTGILWRIR